MSQDEQDQIFGKLTRQHREATQRIAAIEAKVTEAGQSMIQTGNTLIELGRREIRLDAEFLQKLDKQS